MEPVKFKVRDNIKAGLDDAKSPRMRPRRFHRAPLEGARHYLQGKQPEVAVVFAQLAAELATERLIKSLVMAKADGTFFDAVSDLRPGYNICAPPVHDFYSKITGERFRQKTHDFSKALTMHNERRNRIVHRGESCTPDQATNSIEVVYSYHSRGKKS